MIIIIRRRRRIVVGWGGQLMEQIAGDMQPHMFVHASAPEECTGHDPRKLVQPGVS